MPGARGAAMGNFPSFHACGSRRWKRLSSGDDCTCYQCYWIIYLKMVKVDMCAYQHEHIRPPHTHTLTPEWLKLWILVSVLHTSESKKIKGACLAPTAGASILTIGPARMVPGHAQPQVDGILNTTVTRAPHQLRPRQSSSCALFFLPCVSGCLILKHVPAGKGCGRRGRRRGAAVC